MTERRRELLLGAALMVAIGGGAVLDGLARDVEEPRAAAPAGSFTARVVY